MSLSEGQNASDDDPVDSVPSDAAAEEKRENVESSDRATLSGISRKRRAYMREKKLQILKYYHEQGRNKYQTCQRFGIGKPSLLRWIRNEESILKSKKGRKRIGKAGRRPFWPDMEARLVEEFRKTHEKGLKVKHYWFKVRARQLMKEMHPEADFRLTQGWFDRFKSRNNLSYRRSTNVSQKKPSDFEEKIRGFYQEIRRVASAGISGVEQLGKFAPSTIGNVDQTPLPFAFNSGQGYAETGSSTVWHRGTKSGLEKRQCTVQLTIYADGIARVKPLIIFRGKGLRISTSEKEKYDKRVVVKFQVNAWCDEKVMKDWVLTMWRRPLAPEGRKPKLLIADVHKAQTTPEVLEMLKTTCLTDVVLVSPGCTSLVQPLDVSLNSEFKQIIDRLQTEPMHTNLESYTENKLTASDRRILITFWIGTAWEKMCEKKDMIIRAFRKCGISVPIDGSEDDAINIKGLEDYRVRNIDENESASEYDTEDSDSDDIEDSDSDDHERASIDN